MTMSSTTSTYAPFFRSRIIGRAASPPTWACYEQIPFDGDDYSDSGSEDGSCSEDGEDYTGAGADDHSDDEESEPHHVVNTTPGEDHADHMEIDEVEDGEAKVAEFKKDVKGKQRAIEPEIEPETPPKRRHKKKQREHVYTLRPILTIQRSQGFVWNQVFPLLSRRRQESTDIPCASVGFICSSVHQR
jgi:hypothetical protein